MTRGRLTAIAAASLALAALCLPPALVAQDPPPPPTGNEAPPSPPPPAGKEELAVPPQLVKFVEPEYPAEARRDRIEGTVLVKLLIDADGTIVRAEIARGVSEHEVLERAAVAAALQCVFAPGTVGGQPTRMWVQLPFVFALE